MAGALLGFLGITVAGMAIVNSFWFCIGLVMAGGANSFVHSIDLPPPIMCKIQSNHRQFPAYSSEVSRLASSVPDCHAQQRSFVSVPYAGILGSFLLSVLVMIFYHLKF